MTTLKPAVSKNGLLVIPVVAQIPVPQFLIEEYSSSPAAASSSSSSPSTTRDSFSPLLNSTEVSSLFSLPLSHFLSAASASSTGGGYAFRDIDWGGQRVRMHEFVVTLPKSEWRISSDEARRLALLPPGERDALAEKRTFRVWGLTAYILVAAAVQLHGRKPEFSTVAAAVQTKPKL